MLQNCLQNVGLSNNMQYIILQGLLCAPCDLILMHFFYINKPI